jgi:hypothetical protein
MRHFWLYFLFLLSGDAQAYVKSDIVDDGTQAALSFSLLAHDGDSVEQLYTLNQVFWATQDLWTSSGLINASSNLRLVDTIDWNAKGDLDYSNHSYSFLAQDLSQDESSVVFRALGNGTYGHTYAW